jgi:4-amino-4-deoxy-L-arabinose transferase-like glycosyltransferase
LTDPTVQSHPNRIQSTAASSQATAPPALVTGLVLLLAVVAALGAVFGGPALGDHEAIVAECARNMRLTGDWVVPQFLDTAWMRKPPLPSWLVAAASYVLPSDPVTGLPVTTMAARLPSALSALGTILILWHLGSSMFGRRVGRVTAVIASSSVFFLLYAVNATAEMLLTFCCTWAYLHFWYAVIARSPGRRFVHMMLFYVALGTAMLAKGPAPLPLVAAPLAVWWYAERPLRLVARRGLGAWRPAIALFFRGLLPQTIRAFTRLWLIPGLVVFGLLFVPWMSAVADRFEHSWRLWNWQYFQRAQGNYEDTRVRGPFYYVPIVIGLILPWVFLLIEALAAPWLKRYARHRRALFYAGLWALVGLAAMSAMAFKKPYYIAPAVPGLLLLIAVAADRFYSFVPGSAPLSIRLRTLSGWRDVAIADNTLRLARVIWGCLAAGAVLMLVAGAAWLRLNQPAVAGRLTAIVAAALALLLVAGVLYLRGRPSAAMGLTAFALVAAFHTGWYTCGSVVASLDDVADLSRQLDAAGVPKQADIYWVDGRPDARLSFYFGRRPRYMITPEEIVTKAVSRIGWKRELREWVATRADEWLGRPEPVYLIMGKGNYQEMRPFIKNTGRIITTIDSDPTSDAKDWVVVSNVAPKTP